MKILCFSLFPRFLKSCGLFYTILGLQKQQSIIEHQAQISLQTPEHAFLMQICERETRYSQPQSKKIVLILITCSVTLTPWCSSYTDRK